MFLIEDHHRENIKRLMDELFKPGFDHDKKRDWANTLYAIVPDFIPYNPTTLTDQQQSRLWKKWNQSNQNLNYVEFLAGVEPTIGCDGAVAVQWCGMVLCIETDGECHT